MTFPAFGRRRPALALLALSAIGAKTVAPTPETAKPITIGTQAPNAKVQTMDGKATTLKKVFGGKPTVLVFYRGGWCPFCSAHLFDLGQVEKEIQAKGYQIVAVTPDKPENLKETMSKDKLDYTLLSDTKAESLMAYGVAFKLDDATFNTYKNKYGLNLEKRSGESHHILPVPSVFVIGADGKVKFVHSNPDYKVRMKGADLVAAL